ncbi:transporter substrate-binding domain-containing protein [Glaciimonas soli]|nr:transporter substrate-binding domain-containing protein [Glaciimonas soli]
MNIRVVGTAIVAVGFMFFGIAKAADFPAGSTMEAIHKKGKLVVGTSLKLSGFSMQNPVTDTTEGFEIDLARYLAEKLTGSADNVEFVAVISQNRLAFVQTGRVDVALDTVTISDARKKIVGFAGPYFLAGQDVLLAKDNRTIHSVSDLNNQSVCVVTGTDDGVNLLKVAPQAKLFSLADKNSCAEAVADGRYVAEVDDSALLEPLAKLQPAKLKMLGKPFTTEPYGIVVKVDDTVFRNWINTQLEQSIKDGTWMKSYNKNLRDFGAARIPVVDRY